MAYFIRRPACGNFHGGTLCCAVSHFQGARALAAVETEDAAFVLRQLLRRFLDEGFHIAAKVSVTRALS